MRIIFLTREGYRLPGARIRCYNFANELKRYGFETEVFSFSDNLGAKDGEGESQLKMSDKIKYNLRAFNILMKKKDTFLYLQRLNYHSFAPYLTHLLNKNRIILDLDDWEMREDPKYYLAILPSSKAHFLTGQIAKRSTFCVAASRFLEQFLSQFNKRVYYIPTGVDTELFKPPSNGRDDKKIVFSWVGTLHRVEYVENIKFALDCFCRLRRKYSNIFFEVVGDGIYMETLKEVVGKLGHNRIVIKGWCKPEAIPEYLAAIDIGLFPVASRTKFNRAKSPTKLFEYMAMAKPTVSSNIGELPHIIQNETNGFLAETKDEFTEKMCKLIDDPKLRKSLGVKAREAILDNYSLEVLGKQLREILNRI